MRADYVFGHTDEDYGAEADGLGPDGPQWCDDLEGGGLVWRDTSASPGPVVAAMEARPNKPLGEWTAKEIGRQGEREAAVYLESRGYEVVERNWVCPFGEADLVAREGDTCVLVEVKTRLAERDAEVFPELAVDAKKRAIYMRIGEAYLAAHPEVGELRFDVVAINIRGEHALSLRHLVNAFGWDS